MLEYTMPEYIIPLSCDKAKKSVIATLPPEVRFPQAELASYVNEIPRIPLLEAIGCVDCPRMRSRTLSEWHRPEHLSEDDFLRLVLHGILDAYRPELSTRIIDTNQHAVRCPLLDDYLVHPDVRSAPIPCQQPSCRLTLD